MVTMTPEEKRQFICELGITAELFDEMYAESLVELGQRHREFVAAMTSGDRTAMKAAVHAIKGVAGNFRITGVHIAALAVNEHIKGGSDPPILATLAGDLAAAMAALGVEGR